MSRAFGFAALVAAPLLLAAAAPEARMLAPGVISTPANEFGGTMTPDGREIYFTRSVPRSYMYAIYVSRRVKGAWTAPVLAPFAGRGRAFDPTLSPDGRTLVFTSDREAAPGQARHDYDIWMVERAASGAWGKPHNLGAPVNTASDTGEGNEWFASLAADGTLYFAADKRAGGGGMAIYRSRRAGGAYQAPEELGPTINADGFDGEPTIAPDQSFLLFSAFGRKEGYGDWDIYISRRQPDGSWGPPRNLGPKVNTAQRDYSPRLEPDGHTLVFTSERYFGTGKHAAFSYDQLKAGVAGRLNGQGNLYTVDLRTLGVEGF